MKVMKKRVVLKSKQVEHSETEKQLMRELGGHPFIVRYVAALMDEMRLYLVMEYVPGGEMFRHLRAAGRFPNDVTKFYAAEVAAAIGHMHDAEVAYRDLKPENVLLDAEGHVRLADLGFAKRLRGSAQSNTLCGTPEYLAPEIVQNRGHGLPVDWWAMGVFTYEMLAGYTPFFDECPHRAYEAIIEGRTEYPAWFDPRAIDLVKRLLNIKPDRRLGTKRSDQTAGGPGGPDEVRRHPYFGGVDWESLVERCYPAPVAVKHDKPGDTSNFEPYPDSPKVAEARLTKEQLALFSEFDRS